MLSPRSTFQRVLMVYWRDGIDRKTGRNGKTIVKTESWSRLIPSRRPCHLPLTRPVPSRPGNIPLPSRPVDKTCPYRLVPSTKPTPTVPPVFKTFPYCLVLPSKPVPTVKSRGNNLSLPSRPAVQRHHSLPPRCRGRQDDVSTMNRYYSTNIANT